MPPALPAPSLAGGRQLCGCSAHLPPPESPALKLPGYGQPRCHGNCILHPCHRLHLKAIGENRGTGETGEREDCGLAMQPSLLTASHTGSANCPSQIPGPAQSYPQHLGTPQASLVEGGMGLIKISLAVQPQIILVHVRSCQNSDSGAEEKGQEGKGANFQSRPPGSWGL